MRRSIPLLTAASFFILCCPSFSAAPAHRAQLESISSRGLAPDKGKFKDKVNGRQVGTEEFEIAQDSGGWVARATRSEERRVGKECRSRWGRYTEKKKRWKWRREVKD